MKLHCKNGYIDIDQLARGVVQFKVYDASLGRTLAFQLEADEVSQVKGLLDEMCKSTEAMKKKKEALGRLRQVKLLMEAVPEVDGIAYELGNIDSELDDAISTLEDEIE